MWRLGIFLSLWNDCLVKMDEVCKPLNCNHNQTIWGHLCTGESLSAEHCAITGTAWGDGWKTCHNAVKRASPCRRTLIIPCNLARADLIAQDGSSLKISRQSQKPIKDNLRDTLVWLVCQRLRARHEAAQRPMTMLDPCCPIHSMSHRIQFFQTKYGLI